MDKQLLNHEANNNKGHTESNWLVLCTFYTTHTLYLWYMAYILQSMLCGYIPWLVDKGHVQTIIGKINVIVTLGWGGGSRCDVKNSC